MKKIFSGILTIVMILGILATSSTNVWAENEALMTEEKCGYEKPIGIDFGEMENVKEASRVYSTAPASKWDTYSSNYFYNKMSEKGKKLYKSLYDMCMMYLTTTTDAVSSDSATGYTDWVSVPTGMDEIEMKIVITEFITNVPQFYFINSYYGWGSYGSEYIVKLGVYPDFVSGASRSAATSKVSTTVDSWISQINLESTNEAKEKKAHDLICENTSYTFGSYNQSAAGVLLEGKAVCAGYAETFALLCNGAGINTLTVTSDEHEWNIVYLYGNWYNADCTWDDQDYGTIYTFFNKSDTTIQSYGDHDMESVWSSYSVPACVSDVVTTNNSYWDGNRYFSKGVAQSNVFYAPIQDNPSTSWYYFAYSTADTSAGTDANEIRTGWVRDEQTGNLHFAFPENGLLMANMWSSDHRYYFDGFDLAIGKFDANDGYTYFAYSENATINGQKVTGVVQSGWVMDEQTGDLYYCFPENYRMARGITLGTYIFDDSGKCLNP